MYQVDVPTDLALNVDVTIEDAYIGLQWTDNGFGILTWAFDVTDLARTLNNNRFGEIILGSQEFLRFIEKVNPAPEILWYSPKISATNKANGKVYLNDNAISLSGMGNIYRHVRAKAHGVVDSRCIRCILTDFELAQDKPVQITISKIFLKLNLSTFLIEVIPNIEIKLDSIRLDIEAIKLDKNLESHTDLRFSETFIFYPFLRIRTKIINSLYFEAYALL